MEPFTFTYRSNRSVINPELIKAGYWMTKRRDTYFIHERERGKPIGDMISVGDRKTMFEEAEVIVNEHFKKKGWIK
ncbi:MAG: hypothetical protein K0U78_15390 [Actinomycetia bacterium]|nr:hypothetical protein [Actinomycetes bacterium]